MYITYTVNNRILYNFVFGKTVYPTTNFWWTFLKHIIHIYSQDQNSILCFFSGNMSISQQIQGRYLFYAGFMPFISFRNILMTAVLKYIPIY